jgi:spermidine synthase
VRQVRGGLELRVDGTQASVHRPGRSLTGAHWWTLAAPVALVPGGRPRVLVLGLAAGSVARAIRELSPDAEIVGVEYDEGVLRAAREHFGLDGLRLEVITGDALAHLRRERRRFDVVVEDLFVGPARTVHKPEWLLPEGYPLIERRLRPDGFVVSNTIHETPAVVSACRCFGRPIATLQLDGFWNRIVVCGRTLPPAALLRRRLAQAPALRPALRRLAIRSVPSGSTMVNS